MLDAGAALRPGVGRKDVLPHIEGYAIQSVLGRGGMGVVYEAVQEKLGRRVALKLLPAVASSPELVKRFQHEAANSAKLHHTNIIPIYDFGESRDGYYYVMELLEGRPLSDVLQCFMSMDMSAARMTTIARILGTPSISPDTAESRIEPSSDPSKLDYTEQTSGRDRRYYQTVAKWVADIADALHYAHQQGIIHRDVKPGNIFICSDGRAVLLDFGLVKVIGDESFTMTGATLGSGAYMSPEQIGAKRMPLDERTDIYSLGATLYEMLTFRLAFVAPERSQLFNLILTSEPTPARKIVPSVPADLETICLKAMEKAPAARYQTGKAMADDLHLFLRDLPIGAKPPSTLGRGIRYVKRHRTGAIASVAVFLFLVAATVAVAYQNHARESRLSGLVKEGSSYMRLGQWENAEDTFYEVLEMEPESFRGLVNLAITKKEMYYNRRDGKLLDEANSLLDQVLRVRPQRKEIWNMKGIILRTQGALDEALEALRRSKDLDDKYYSTWVNMGSVYALQGDLQAAESHLRHGVGLLEDERDPLPWHNLAAVQVQMAKSEALESIEAALAADKMAGKKGIPAQLLRAKLHLALKEHLDAKEALRYAIAADVNSVEEQGNARLKRVLAWAYMRNEQWAEAAEAAQAALQQGDVASYPHFILAAAEARRGANEVAREHVAQALAAWPEQLQQRGFQAYVEGGLIWFDSQEGLLALQREAAANAVR